jgi:AcrR family transcriptional regulator
MVTFMSRFAMPVRVPPQTGTRPPAQRRSVVARARRRSQAERSAETRTRILKAAASLIRARGYARFRTADVAAAAGLSRGAQLHHFPTKDALVVATLVYVFEQAQVLSRRRASAVNRPRDLIEAVIADAREFFFSEHFKIAMDIVLSTSTHQSVRKQILDVSRKARRPVEAAWTEALASSGVPGPLAADIVALTLSVVRGLAIRTLWDNDPQWFDRLFGVWREMIKVFLADADRQSKMRA